MELDCLLKTTVPLSRVIYIFIASIVDQELQDRNEEKNELAKALTRSYEELQKARTESAQVSYSSLFSWLI